MEITLDFCHFYTSRPNQKQPCHFYLSNSPRIHRFPSTRTATALFSDPYHFACGKALSVLMDFSPSSPPSPILSYKLKLEWSSQSTKLILTIPCLKSLNVSIITTRLSSNPSERPQDHPRPWSAVSHSRLTTRPFVLKAFCTTQNFPHSPISLICAQACAWGACLSPVPSIYSLRLSLSTACPGSILWPSQSGLGDSPWYSRTADAHHRKIPSSSFSASLTEMRAPWRLFLCACTGPGT